MEHSFWCSSLLERERERERERGERERQYNTDQGSHLGLGRGCSDNDLCREWSNVLSLTGPVVSAAVDACAADVHGNPRRAVILRGVCRIARVSGLRAGVHHARAFHAALGVPR